MSFFGCSSALPRWTASACPWGAFSLLIAVLLAGCITSESPFRLDSSEMAQRYLPYERDVPHHPDSLKHVRIVEKENTLQLQMEMSFRRMTEQWSSTFQSRSAGSSARRLPYQSYATLWSLDLSIASLQPEVGFSGLSKDLARQRLSERRAAYDSLLQVDIYRYQGSPIVRRGDISETNLTGPGSRVMLRDDRGNEYKPVREETTPPRDGFIQGRSVIYRRNTFFFDRVVDGKDILNNVGTLRLWVRESFGNDYYFRWSFEEIEGRSSTP
jgi:hypothetical protein